jgi:hypothetical protein
MKTIITARICGADHACAIPRETLHLFEALHGSANALLQRIRGGNWTADELASIIDYAISPPNTDASLEATILRKARRTRPHGHGRAIPRSSWPGTSASTNLATSVTTPARSFPCSTCGRKRPTSAMRTFRSLAAAQKSATSATASIRRKRSEGWHERHPAFLREISTTTPCPEISPVLPVRRLARLQ